jgi:hypothetical protein
MGDDDAVIGRCVCMRRRPNEQRMAGTAQEQSPLSAAGGHMPHRDRDDEIGSGVRSRKRARGWNEANSGVVVRSRSSGSDRIGHL